jgi:mevalonate kinase
MPPEIHEVASNLSVVQKELAQFSKFVDRMDVTIEKLTEVSSTVSQLLAVQGNRLESQEKLMGHMQSMLDKRKDETDKNTKDIYEKIQETENNIYEEIEVSNEKILLEVKNLAQKFDDHNKVTNDRITKIEKWMWTAIGVTSVLVLFIDKVNLGAIF